MLGLKEPLTHAENQFVLYTKGHYDRSEDKMEDLKTIVAEAYGIEDVQMYSVVHFVNTLFEKLIVAGYIRTAGKSPVMFLLDSIFWDDLKREDGSLIDFMCARIQYVPVTGLDLAKYATRDLRLALSYGSML